VLKLKKYSFSGVGRFVDKQTIDLESKSHLIQIDGHNTNTGGSSGAGKSTTVEALAFLLGISEIPATQLQSRITDDPMWVQGEFEGGIIITRSKKEGLTIQTPDETVSGNSKLAEEKLDEIIGVNRDLLKTMCYKRQKQGGFFLNLTPKQSYDFLMQCLDLREFQNKIFKLDDLLKNKYKPKKIELESSVKTLNDGIDQLRSLLFQKTPPQKEEQDDSLLKTSIQDLKMRLEALQEERDQLIDEIGSKPELVLVSFEKDQELSNINNQISELKIIISNNVNNKNTEIQQASSAIFKIREHIKELNQLKNKAVELDSFVQKLCNELKHLEAGDCPTCLRVWETEENAQKMQQIANQIESNKKIIEEYLKEVQKIPHYKMMEKKAEELLQNRIDRPINVLEEKDLIELQEKRRVLMNEKENIKSTANQECLKRVNEWNYKILNINKKYNEESSGLETQISHLAHEIEKIQLKKNNYTQALEIYEKDCKNIKDKISLNSDELQKQLFELKTLEKNTLLSEESIRLIKNFTLQKFQDTLNYVGHRATEIINLIPNMANAVIFFENSKETKSGSIKNEVNAVINLEGDSAVSIKTLSGGERTSADFAIDLAVGEMIENMTQKGVNFFIIDEGFDGLDSVSKIECLEILKNLNTNKKILMVDHSSEVKEMIYDTIIVKRIGEKSFIYE
jgi:DNA repair exonuclease SbcCD ATPase subunit